MKTVTVEIYNMYSDAGYVPSSGEKTAYILDSAKAYVPDVDLVKLAWGKSLREIKPDDLIDPTPIRSYSGVLNREGWRGLVEIEDNQYVVQVVDEYICTRDNNEPYAWIVE